MHMIYVSTFIFISVPTIDVYYILCVHNHHLHHVHNVIVKYNLKEIFVNIFFRVFTFHNIIYICGLLNF